MAVHLMNRWTYPLANRPIQSRCSGLIDLHAYAGDVVYGHTRTTILRERRGGPSDKPGRVLGQFSLDSGLVNLRVWGR